MKANIIKVKVYPKDLKAIPDVLPFNQLLQAEPMELELTKKEICRCMNFGDVYDITSGEEVLIDEISFKDIEEFVEDKASTEESSEEEAEPDQGSEVTDESGVEESTEEPEEIPQEESTEEPITEEEVNDDEEIIEEEV